MNRVLTPSLINAILYLAIVAMWLASAVLILHGRAG